MFDIQKVQVKEKVGNAALVSRPIPIGERETRIADQFPADQLEIGDVVSMPMWEVGKAVRAKVKVDKRLISPVAGIALWQIMHALDGFAILDKKRV
jgi:hypothetical protein